MDHSPVTRKTLMAISLFVFLLALANGVLLFTHRLYSGGDNLDFILLARSFQHGYWSAMFGWPRPPGYSAYLAILLKLSGTVLNLKVLDISTAALMLIKVLNVLQWAVLAVVVFLWSRKISGRNSIAFLTAALFSLSQQMAATASIIGNEPMFLLVSYAALFFWDSAAGDQERRRTPIVAAVILSVLGLFIKYQCWALAMAVIVWGVLYRRCSKKYWISMAVVTVFFLLSFSLQWFSRENLIMDMGAEKPGLVAVFLERMRVCVPGYGWGWADLIWPKMLGDHGLYTLAGVGGIQWIHIITLLAISLVGFVSTVRSKGFTVSHAYVIMMTGMLFMWPLVNQRYLLPLLPAGLLFFVEGARFILEKTLQGARRPALAGCLFAVFAIFLITWNVSVNVFAGIKNWKNIVQFRHEPLWAPDRYLSVDEGDFADYIRAGMWLRDCSPSNSIVFCRKSPIMELVSGRNSRPYTKGVNVEGVDRLMTSQAALAPTYVIRDAFSPSSGFGKTRILLLDPAIKKFSAHYRVVYTTPLGAEIMEVIP